MYSLIVALRSAGQLTRYAVINRGVAVVLLLCGLLIVGKSAAAQPSDVKFTALASKDGLASNTVYAILKDRYGLLWIASDEGLRKYDGYRFSLYHLGPRKTSNFQAVDISSLHEDQAGRLWVGTMGRGLHLYNRALDTFVAYDGRLAAGMQDNRFIKQVSSDALGNIWTVAAGEVRRINPKTARVTPVPFAQAGGPARSIAPQCIYTDKKQRTWLGTNSGLFRYNPATRMLEPFAPGKAGPQGLAGDTINAITQDRNGQLWVGTTNGLSRLATDERGFDTFKFKYNDPHTIGSNFIFTLAAGRDGTVWVGTEGGLDIINVQSGQATRYAHNSRDAYSLNSKSVRSILLDPQGINWIGTYKGGVSKHDQNLTLFDSRRNNELDPLGLNSPLVTSFAEKRNGDLYVGTDGGGLNVYHVKTGLFSHLDIKSKKRVNLAGLPIQSLLLDRHEQLWMGTFDHGLFVLDTKTGAYEQRLRGPGKRQLNNNQIYCLKEDRAGHIWIGTNGGGVNMYDPKTGVITKFTDAPKDSADKKLPINNYIRGLEEDAAGNIWIGSVGGGIAVYHPGSKQFTVYNFAKTGLNLDHITTIAKDRRGTMWMGTIGNGLYQFDARTKKFATLSSREKLPDGYIHKILEDNTGAIWISTNRGISRLDTKQGKFTNYSQENGLQNKAFLNNSGIKAADGTLFFGGIEGFNYFSPSRLKINRNVPPVVLTDLRVDNKPVVLGEQSPLRQHITVAKEIHLNYKQNFALSYAALNYTLPQKNHYAYKLVGFDKDWNYVGTATSAYYTNLDPGEYDFVVKASNNDGIWNTTGTRVRIIIQPPFWKTIYAYVLYAGVVGAALFYSRYRGIRKLKEEFEQQQEREEAERIRKLDLLKIKFLTNLSHEFRTPISLILAPTAKLLAQQKDPQSAGQLRVIRRNAHRLLHLVNQLLDSRKMEEHELHLQLSAGELTGFVQEVASSFQDLAEIKKIDLSIQLAPEKLYVRFDYDKVERIMVNLLSNAFKFTPEGGKVSVELSAHSAVPDAPEKIIRLRIADTGSGIEASQQELIFERFFQGHELSSVLNQSNGIGLSITKEFVELHGGSIAVESELGKGARFTVLLPLELYAPLTENGSTDDSETRPTVQDRKKPPKPPKKPKAGELPHLLIVEDDDDFRYYLKDNLKDHYKITDVLNGKDGWYKALSCHPDLIVSDITMPYMDGIALSRKLKSDKRTSHIPIILLTGLTREEEHLKGLESGANDYLSKPFNFDILHVRIKNLLELNRTLKTTYTKQLQVVPSPVEIESSSEKFLNNVVLYIERNLKNTNFSVEELSEQFGMSRGSMYNKILELTGMPPVEFIRSLKLDRAAVLLQESDLTISEVAYQAGFATPHYFTKSFKAKFNILPSDYRKSKKP
ncbi:response regulator [Hymenobacter sp. BT186]|uniref:histidine kinase n=1 Tax=Hymenobacter telluris TaxID=2816474 RepID=A0A939JAZ5_9BACT|nr:hybrid sensor histidine kinase/response regulator transcription factor [Hymenobacter telluris]MBO0356770.1 response regulator [Hymenobacter telluris]MBW3372796.1 response regulator [Hymenobacter norwichensis]